MQAADLVDGERGQVVGFVPVIEPVRPSKNIELHYSERHGPPPIIWSIHTHMITAVAASRPGPDQTKIYKCGSSTNQPAGTTVPATAPIAAVQRRQGPVARAL